jgi:hypothetical protein
VIDFGITSNSVEPQLYYHGVTGLFVTCAQDRDLWWVLCHHGIEPLGFRKSRELIHQLDDK